MERWDPHAARRRLMCHRQAAQRLMDGQTPVPGGPGVLHQTLGMPQEDARAVGERVSAELALRTGL
jgi:hypothetical protein